MQQEESLYQKKLPILLLLTKIIRKETEGKIFTSIELSSIFNFSDWGPKNGIHIGRKAHIFWLGIFYVGIN